MICNNNRIQCVFFVCTDSRRSNTSGPATDEHVSARLDAAAPPDCHRRVFDAQLDDSSGTVRTL